MSRTQRLVILVMFFLNIADGYDILAISFAAPGIAKELGLPATSLGLLFSAAFVGMAIGAFLISPMADRIGRKPVLVLCLTLMATGMFLSAIGRSFNALWSYRFCTGLGVGAMLPTINAVIAEFSSERRRGLCISISQTGFSLGSVLGGLVAGAVLAPYGWPAVFLAGGAICLTGLILVVLIVAESPDWLSQKQPRNALARLNRVLVCVGRAPVQSLPAVEAKFARQGPKVLLAPPLLRPTLFVSLCYLLMMAGYYSYVSWMPKLMVQQGTIVEQAVGTVTFATTGALLGGLVFGILSTRFGVIRLAMVSLFGASASLVAFAAFERTGTADGIAFAFGTCIGFSLVGLYAVLAETYSASIRATAAGVAIGASRIGAMSGPALFGYVLGAGVNASASYMVMALFVAFAGLSLLGVRARSVSLAPTGSLGATEGRPAPKRV